MIKRSLSQNDQKNKRVGRELRNYLPPSPNVLSTGQHTMSVWLNKTYTKLNCSCLLSVHFSWVVLGAIILIILKKRNLSSTNLSNCSKVATVTQGLRLRPAFGANISVW